MLAAVYSSIRPLLFSFPPETSHGLALAAVSTLGDALGPPRRTGRIDVAGLSFPGVVGLAAGCDKNGLAIDGWARLGFSFVEFGTVTPRAQTGNPKPRMFRLPTDAAIINRLGFNGGGLAVAKANVQRSRASDFGTPVGANIGKNLATPLDRAVEDYQRCFAGLAEEVDYITVNLSSPNTPGLRDLQGEREARRLLEILLGQRDEIRSRRDRPLPVFVKVDPDRDVDALLASASTMCEAGVDGIIATNTTVSRDRLAEHCDEAGGLSGHPLFDRSLRTVETLRRHVGDAVALIGVGGIDSSARALAMLSAGADLVQVYTGLVYRGPQLIRDIESTLGSMGQAPNWSR